MPSEKLTRYCGCPLGHSQSAHCSTPLVGVEDLLAWTRGPLSRKPVPEQIRRENSKRIWRNGYNEALHDLRSALLAPDEGKGEKS
jgi:hypothetical protein